MNAWTTLLDDLSGMPDELERAMARVPEERLGWRPADWGGSPGETFTVLEHVCHLRDIERDGYHVRVRRLLEEESPSLVSLDGYEMARERRYAQDDAREAAAAFRAARAETLARLRGLDEAQLRRSGEFAEYGRLTLVGLVQYLRSHDLQHLAGLHWLAGRIASEAA